MIPAIVYHVCTGLATLIALVDWRIGLILCIIFDGIRDPIRKITPEYPVIITLTIVGLWLATFLGACLKQSDRLRLAREFYPQSRMVGWSLVCALIPAAAVSLVSYQDGWIFAAIGVISYSFPIVGLTVGIAYLRSARDVMRPMAWYCLINGVIMIGAYLEHKQYPIQGLRGMNVLWVRHQWGYHIDLICGFYRSPDLLGLHAAHVIMFTTLILMRSRSRLRWIWLPLDLYAAWCLLICGRRKMIVMPFVFFAVVLYRGLKQGRAMFALKAGTVIAVVSLLFVAFFPADLFQDYLRFAETSQSEGLDRISRSGVGGFFESIRQAGVLGNGLGTSTQGGSQIARHSARTWQEDGISRIGAEFGVPGSIAIMIALFGVGAIVWKAIRCLPQDSRASALQHDLLGILAANASSFIISHQAFSGDPSAIAIASLMLGFVLAIPLLGEEAKRQAAEQARLAARRAAAIAPANPVVDPLQASGTA